jgi:hypothetical protein
MQFIVRFGSALLLALVVLSPGDGSFAGETTPCVSGLNPGRRPGPYSAIVAVGEKRGQSHCFICETEDRPAVIVFARGVSDPLGKLVAGLDDALRVHKAAELRAWVTFLGQDPAVADPMVVEWGKKHAVRSVPLSVFADAGGPPSYRLHRDADVTVLLSVKQKVVRNFAFRAGELTDERIAEVLKALPEIVTPEKK